MANIKEKIKIFFERFFLINDTPEKIAGGFALGVFLGIIPGGIASALILASFFRLNRLAAVSGVMATNMWSTLAILPLAALVGSALFGRDYAELVVDYKSGLNFGWDYFFGKIIFFDVTLPLLLGFFVIALGIAILAYFIMYGFLKHKRVKMKK